VALRIFLGGREDMVKNVAECPGMCSDHPGITPKVLPLESFTHVLERERDGNGGVFGRFGGRGK